MLSQKVLLLHNLINESIMRQQLLIVAVGCAMAVQAQSPQTSEGTNAPLFETPAKEEIAANRYLAGSNYLDYDRQLTDKPLTPSPKGYEPFYMSHYGRHGSRWLIWEGDYTLPLNTLKDAREAGKLTATGEETLKKLEAFFPTTTKRLGDLTTVGERQHHGIGRRMAQHFPEIFKTKGLPIDARSTTVFRCILSMIAECEELAAANPTARIHNDVSESLQYYLNAKREGLVEAQGRKGRELRHSLKGNMSPDRLMGELFSDPQWVADSIKAESLAYNLFEVTTNMQSHDNGIDLYPLFTDEEIYQQWRIRNIGWYVDYGAAPQTESVMPYSQKHLLHNIIETADTVSQPQATLRFGHEVCVMPLACLLELDSCGARVSDLDQLDRVWRNYRIFPMACNIQMVFYRKADGTAGDVLVKVLLNERECSLPVESSQHPYYRWSVLRQYYLDKLQQFDAREQAGTAARPLEEPQAKQQTNNNYQHETSQKHRSRARRHATRSRRGTVVQ